MSSMQCNEKNIPISRRHGIIKGIDAETKTYWDILVGYYQVGKHSGRAIQALDIDKW